MLTELDLLKNFPFSADEALSRGNSQTQRFFSLDAHAYAPGALPTKTKELLGLVASGVLRNDDCIAYHLLQCAKEGVTKEELLEAFGIILTVGGSITLPHIRRAMDALQKIDKEGFGTWYDAWRQAPEGG